MDIEINDITPQPIPPPKIEEIVLRLTPEEAATVRRSLYVGAQLYSGHDGRDVAELARTFKPLKGAQSLFHDLVAARIGQ
jgi:hypothetical protein